MFMEPWILRGSCKVNVKPRASLSLQETLSIHDSMTFQKLNSFLEKYQVEYKDYLLQSRHLELEDLETVRPSVKYWHKDTATTQSLMSRLAILTEVLKPSAPVDYRQ